MTDITNSNDLRIGDDGKQRCGWGTSDPLYIDYHDYEWGRPLRDERALFELMSLEAFQSGLSWLIILRNVPGSVRRSTASSPTSWPPTATTTWPGSLPTPRIVRNRAKVEATVANARAVVALHEQGGSLVDLVFSHAPGADERPPGRFRAFADMPSTTPASTALAKDLRQRGFRFVGPTVAYSLMQAGGVVDDHLEGCWVDVLAEN